VPVIGGALRVTSLAGGAETPDNERFFAMPVPVLLHIFGASTFIMLGAFQFHPGLRRRHPAWHRWAGRVFVLSGLIASGAGLWMVRFYPHPPLDGPLLLAFRYVFGSLWFGCLVVGFIAIRRRDIRQHRAWMMRAYAIAQGAGTQAVLFGLWAVAVGPVTTQLTRALLHGVAWIFNLALAEWLIRRGRAPRRSARPAPTPILEAS
jgi:uncharacterized membrane protein